MKSFGKYYFKLIVEFKTASILHIGDGNEEWFEEAKNKKGDNANFSVASVVLDKMGRPFIPGTSLAGVARHFLEGEIQSDEVNGMFGNSSENGDGERSKLYFHDSSALTMQNSEANRANSSDKLGFAEIRKRTKVNSETGTADTDERGLFSTAFVPAGHSGKFVIEGWSDSEDKQNAQIEAVKKLILGYDLEYLRIGANTTNGSGVLEIKKARIEKLDFSSDLHKSLKSYINGGGSQEDFNYSDAGLKKEMREFELVGNFKSGFYSGGDITAEPRGEKTSDISISLKNKNGQFIIPGSAIKGLLRYECERIYNSANGTSYSNVGDGDNECPLIRKMFGFTEKNNGYNGQKGLIYCEDVVLDQNSVKELRKNRTPIDRFIFGVIDGMLATYQSVKPNDEISIRVLFDENKFDELNKTNHDLNYAKKLLKLALERIAKGKIALGGTSAIGNGYFTRRLVDETVESEANYAN